jgi:hypothetical protein
LGGAAGGGLQQGKAENNHVQGSAKHKQTPDNKAQGNG